MSRSLRKAQEITDARITFVSLVDKAANQRTFLLKKSADGKAEFTTYGKILKADADTHHVTGIVYEPMAEDSHGNFMTEDEITKAAYWFAKNGDNVDLQHSFEPFEGATVVETWVAKADFDIDGQAVKKGTWLMTVEVNDADVWNAIENGDITGLSMGGVGKYSEEDVDLAGVSKGQTAATRKSLLKQLAEALGFNTVEKGDMADLFEERSKGTLFWEAFSAVQSVLQPYDPLTGRYEYETDEAKVREALAEFSDIISNILTSGEPIAKALQTDQPVKKAGRKMSGKNRDTLKGIVDSLGAFLKEFDDPDDEEGPEDPDNTKKKEDKEVNKQEMQAAIDEAVTKAVAKAMGGDGAPAPEGGEATPAPAQETPVTKAAVEQMVADAIQKALNPDGGQEDGEAITADKVEKMVAEAVAKAVEPVLKARGLPSNLGSDTVEKSGGEPHYLHGIL